MTDTWTHESCSGYVTQSIVENDIHLFRFVGEISMDLTQTISDYIADGTSQGHTRIILSVHKSTPLFTLPEFISELERICHAISVQFHMYYVAPLDQFPDHFMIAQTVGFNEGADIRVFETEIEAISAHNPSIDQ